MTFSRRGALLLAPFALLGCEELRTPPAAPSQVLASRPDPQGPMRATVNATAAAFIDQGQRLAGHPAEAALALARLEALEMEVADRRAWPQLAQAVVYSMRIARDESRAALGTLGRAPGRDVVQALAAASTALRRNDRAAAVAALSPTLFEPGGEATLDRLGALGPLPAAEQATSALARDVRRLDLDRGWDGAGGWWQNGAGGIITDGLGTGN